MTSLNLTTFPDKWQDVLRDPRDIGHPGFVFNWQESAALILLMQITRPST